MNTLTKLVRTAIPVRWVSRFQRAIFSRLGLKWRLASGVQIEVLSRTDWTLYNDLFVNKEYDAAIDELMRLISFSETRTDVDQAESKLVVDLGANVGFFILRVIDRLRFGGFGLDEKSDMRLTSPPLDIIAIEPSEDNVRELAKRITPQESDSKGIHIQIVGGLVGALKSGVGRLFESHNHGMNTLSNDLRYPGSRAVPVPYLDLEKVVPTGREIDLLKCDIEGAELDFARAYPDLLKRVKIAVFEVHHVSCNIVALEEALDSAGLSCRRLLVDRGNTSVRLYTRI